MKENGECYKFNTEDPKKHYYYGPNYKGIIGLGLLKLNNVVFNMERDITNDRVITKLRSRYKGIERVFLLKAV